jgi:tetratricopeptide (TPR) repeat protein
MSSNPNTDPKEAWKTLFDQFRVEVDPTDLENSLRELQEKIRQVANEGRYTKVRISYKGAPLCPDIPIGVLVAAEMAGLVFLGPLRAIMLTLNANAFLDIQLIHESSELVKQGQEHYGNGDIELAEQCYLEALQIRSQDMEAHYHLGVLYRVQGKSGEAREHLQQVIASKHPIWSAKAQTVLDKMNGVVDSPST